MKVKETKEQNAKLRKELQQLKNQLGEEKHEHDMDKKEMREKDEAIKRMQKENRQLVNEISEMTAEVNAKEADVLALMSTQEDTQDELEVLRRQIPELESSWLEEKGEKEKLKLEMSTLQKLYNDLKIVYDNLQDEINSSQEQFEEKDSIHSTELQKLNMEKEQLKKELQLLSKRIGMLKENNEKTQKEKKELEQKLRTTQQRLLVLEVDEKTIDTIKALQEEVKEGKQKLRDLNEMYEAIRVERDNLRSDKIKPKSPRTFTKSETKPRAANILNTPKSNIQHAASPKKEVFDAQARAVPLEDKLRVARERLEGLKTSPPKNKDMDEVSLQENEGWKAFSPCSASNEHRESNDTDGASEVISDENAIQGKWEFNASGWTHSRHLKNHSWI